MTSYVEKKQLLPEAQCGFPPGRSTTDTMFVIRRPQELGRKEHVQFFICFGDLQKAYHSIDRVVLWVILDKFCVPPKTISIIHQFHDGMRACVPLDDGRASEWF